MKKLAALTAVLILATGTLTACESDEHKEAVSQYQEAWEAYEKARDAVQPDIKFCKESIWNCNARLSGYYRYHEENFALGDEPDFKKKAEEIKKQIDFTSTVYDEYLLTEIEFKWTTESGLDKEATYKLPLDKKALDEEDGLTIEQLMDLKKKLNSSTNGLTAKKEKFSEEVVQASKKRLNEFVKGYSESCTYYKTTHDEDEHYNATRGGTTEGKTILVFIPRTVRPWTEEHERACNVVWKYDENKDYTVEELVNLLGDFYGVKNYYTQK